MEIRSPKKSEGVPKESIEKNCIGDLADALKVYYSGIEHQKILDCAVLKGYFEAPMTKQLDILAEVIFELLKERSDKVIEALITSTVDKVNAIAVSVISILYEKDIDSKLKWLKNTAALKGTWPRETSCTALHNLFIRDGVESVLQKVYPWLMDSNEGVRRIVTEGIRPRLMMVPHIEELKRDPSILKKVFEPLLEDPTDYVRKSVGNCMNDVSKDNPKILLDWLEEWSQEPLSKERKQIFTRALRTLIEKGEKRAYNILDIPMNASVELNVKKGFPLRVALNEVINLEIEVKNSHEEPIKAVFDLIIQAPGKNGQKREYIYKISTTQLKSGETKMVKKTIHFIDKTTQTKENGVYEVAYRKNTEVFHKEKFKFER